MITDKEIVEEFKSNGFGSLTEIQKKVIPVVNRRRNCLLASSTGSGKTEWLVIPIFSILKSYVTMPNSIKAVDVTPLRALNNDVFSELLITQIKCILTSSQDMEIPVSVQSGNCCLTPPTYLSPHLNHSA